MNVNDIYYVVAELQTPSLGCQPYCFISAVVDKISGNTVRVKYDVGDGRFRKMVFAIEPETDVMTGMCIGSCRKGNPDKSIAWRGFSSASEAKTYVKGRWPNGGKEIYEWVESIDRIAGLVAEEIVV